MSVASLFIFGWMRDHESEMAQNPWDIPKMVERIKRDTGITVTQTDAEVAWSMHRDAKAYETIKRREKA